MGEHKKEWAQIYSGLKVVRSCSFHGPIRIKSIPPAPPDTPRFEVKQPNKDFLPEKESNLNDKYTLKSLILMHHNAEERKCVLSVSE